MRILTSGESHGKQLTGIIEGFPAGLQLDKQFIQTQLSERKKGYGRGGRMKIESDTFEIVSGLRGGITTGAPITIIIENKDYGNWLDVMDAWNKPTRKENKHTPRPGHADLGGSIKYKTRDIRNIIERSSARETAMRVAIGAICEMLLNAVKIKINTEIVRVGKIFQDEESEEAQKFIDRLRKAGDTSGGEVAVSVCNMPIGFGDFMHFDNRLDAHLSFAIMSIQAAKGISFGESSVNSFEVGSTVHDQIDWNVEKGFHHLTNHAGGIVGGMTNGETIKMHIQVKPIPTLAKPLQSINILSHEKENALYERSDVTVLYAFSQVAKAMTSIKLCEVLLNDYTHTHIDDIKINIERIRTEALKF